MTQWLNHISSLSILFPLLTALYKYRRLHNGLKFLAWLFIFGFTVELVINIAAVLKFHNLWIFNIFALAEAFVLIYIIGRWFHSSRMYKAAMFLFALYGLSCDHFRTQRTLLCEPRLAGIGRLVLDEFVSENRHGRAALPANDAAAGQVP